MDDGDGANLFVSYANNVCVVLFQCQYVMCVCVCVDVFVYVCHVYEPHANDGVIIIIN